MAFGDGHRHAGGPGRAPGHGPCLAERVRLRVLYYRLCQERAQAAWQLRFAAWNPPPGSTAAGLDGPAPASLPSIRRSYCPPMLRQDAVPRVLREAERAARNWEAWLPRALARDRRCRPRGGSTGLTEWL